MAFDVISTLELDKELLDGKIILINEEAGCDASFFYGCLMAKQIKDGGAICIVTVQNDFNHFYNIGLKLGYNLINLKNNGKVIHIDVLELISNSILKFKDNERFRLTSCDDSSDSLYKMIENAVASLEKLHKSVTIVVDDLTNLSNLDYSICEISNLVQKCKSLVINKNCSVLFGVHVLSATNSSHVMAKLLSHGSDIVCEVAPLSTGRSTDVSGSFRVIRPWADDDVKGAGKLTSINHFLFKVFDRGVKVFAHGLK